MNSIYMIRLLFLIFNLGIINCERSGRVGNKAGASKIIQCIVILSILFMCLYCYVKWFCKNDDDDEYEKTSSGTREFKLRDVNKMRKNTKVDVM